MTVVFVTPAAAATTLEVEPGYAGTYLPGRPVPVRVRVTADRLLSAELHVSADGPSTAVAIEVPGGTTKEFLVVVPTTSNRFESVTATASLPGVSGTAPAKAPLSPAGDQESVGLLPGALAGRPVPGAAPLAIDAGTARFVALSPLELEQAPASLLALGTIGVAADELGRQSDAIRTALLRWVELGGRLLVDAEPGTTIVGLPAGWQPGTSGRARAGEGEVRMTAGAMAAGRWSGLVEPTSRFNSNDGFRMGGPPLGDLLASEAGFRVARISWLVGYLVVYVAVIGPVLFIVLRRLRRPELAWVAVPLIALLFTGGSWVSGRGLRSSTPAVHGTVLVTGEHGTTALTFLGVSSRSGGTVRFGYPGGWTTGTNEAASVQRSESVVRATGAGVTAELPLDPGQFALVSGQGAVPFTGGMTVTARAGANGRVEGTVKNTTDLTLGGVAVMVGTASTTVGPLNPGDEAEFSAVANPDAGFGRPAEFQIWGLNEWSMGPMADGWTRYALWSAAVGTGLVGQGGGQAVAVGWTRDYRPPVEVNGSTLRLDGHTLVTASAPVAGTDRLAQLAVRAQAVRVPDGRSATAVVRLALPAEQAATTARLKVGLPTLPAEVWANGAWTPLNCDAGVCAQVQNRCPPGVPCPFPPDGMIVGGGPRGSGAVGEAALPAGAVRDGAVYLRFSSGMPSGPFGVYLPTLLEAS